MSSSLLKDLNGLTQLSQDGILGMTAVVEAMHQRVYTLGGFLPNNNPNTTTGLTGFIYKTIRNTTRLTYLGLNFGLNTLTPLNNLSASSKHRNQWVSMLNGVLGDHLITTNNPLAITMSFRFKKSNITAQQAAQICIESQTQPLILIHGLCMNDQLWERQQHDHGAELAQKLPLTAIYVRYNTGLSIHENGQKLLLLLKDFTNALPTNTQYNVLCHSMGGLVMRSAIQAAEHQDNKWLKVLNHVVFLGTPHQGARLEQSGQLLDYLLSINPYSAPLAKLTGIRSQGIKDLRQGTISSSSSSSSSSNSNSSSSSSLNHNTYSIPETITAHCIAGSRTENDTASINSKGDGLVTVKSALGQHRNKEQCLNIPIKRQLIMPATNHMQLLSSKAVFKHLLNIYSAK